MADQPTHELSWETQSKFRTAIAIALGHEHNKNDLTVDAVMDQINDLLVAIDVNADRRGYERARGEYQDAANQAYKAGGPIHTPGSDFTLPLDTLAPPETVVLITRDGTEVMRVRI